MSTRSRIISKRKRLMAQMEFETNLAYLQMLEFDLKYATRHEKLQRLIHRKKGWRLYTV